jgi:high affinity Mn2+ porin
MTQIKKSLREAALPVAIATCLGLFSLLPSDNARADEIGANATNTGTGSGDQGEAWALHEQFTNITQGYPGFTSPYSGANSLTASSPIEETTDATLFAGVRLPYHAEFWLNAEIDQGFGLSNTLGVAGYPSGGAYKLGANTPYLRLPRAFFRQVYSLGGEEQKIESAANQLSGVQTANNVVLTVGKFAVPDIFDTNSYAHDPRADFLNWSLIDGGAFDYSADVWGYSYGAAVEWNQDWWTLRSGFFAMSSVPNAKITRVNFGQNEFILEGEIRHQWLGHPGKIKLLTYVNRAHMANYDEAVALAQQTHTVPDVAQVRHFSSRPGIVLNVEQQLTADIGAFARASAVNGQKEAYEFTDIDQSISGGLSIKGAGWGRGDDTIGVAGVVNRISGAAQTYFADGGMGILIGDGKLSYAPERIFETYYEAKVMPHLALTFDYQYVTNPGYNQDRGPVSLYAMRLHADF